MGFLGIFGRRAGYCPLDNPGRSMVLGATGGIGRAYTEQLAALGQDLLLVGRNRQRLDEFAAGLRAAHRVDVATLAADLGQEEGLQAIESRLREDPRLHLLVNAAGLASWGRFTDLDWQREMDLIRVNVIATVRLTRAALSCMLPRGRGGIINVASLAGFSPLPFCATYGGTKAYLISFTQAVYEEIRGSGVRLQVACPGFTKTEMFERSGADAKKLPSFIWIRAETIANSSLEALRRDRAVCIPGLGFRLLGLLMRVAPQEGVRRRTAQFFGKFDTYRLEDSPSKQP